MKKIGKAILKAVMIIVLLFIANFVIDLIITILPWSRPILFILGVIGLIAIYYIES